MGPPRKFLGTYKSIIFYSKTCFFRGFLTSVSDCAPQDERFFFAQAVLDSYWALVSPKVKNSRWSFLYFIPGAAEDASQVFYRKSYQAPDTGHLIPSTWYRNILIFENEPKLTWERSVGGGGNIKHQWRASGKAILVFTNTNKSNLSEFGLAYEQCNCLRFTAILKIWEISGIRCPVSGAWYQVPAQFLKGLPVFLLLLEICNNNDNPFQSQTNSYYQVNITVSQETEIEHGKVLPKTLLNINTLKSLW